MTAEQRLNRITSILSIGVIRMVTEAKKQEAVRSQIALMSSNDQLSQQFIPQNAVTAAGSSSCNS